MTIRASINEPSIGGVTVSVGGNFRMQVPSRELAERIMDALTLAYQQGHEDRVQIIQSALHSTHNPTT
jgi:hypothetical protein